MTKKTSSDAGWKDRPLFAIGVVAELIEISPQTLRLYEKNGLLKPSRKNKNRLYSENDIKWLYCLRDLLHEKKLSIEGVKKLLEYAPCWELRECPEDMREECSAFKTQGKPCWEINKVRCEKVPGDVCETCVVYLSKKGR
ncbi:MerR family transcriptional regulator [Acidobacteriota bacterium]